MKDKKFQTVFGSIMAVGVLGLGFFLVSGGLGYKKLRKEYDDTSAKVLQLKKRPLFPSDENLEAKKEQVAEYLAASDKLHEEVARSQRALKPVTPQQFSNIALEKYNKISDLAKERDVTLPDNFYLGMEIYKTGVPAPHATSILEWELDAIYFLCSMFIEAGVDSIMLLDRRPIPMEEKDYDEEKYREEQAKAGPAPARGSDLAYEPGRILDTLRFTVRASGGHAAIHRAIMGMANAKEFFYWPRVIRVENAEKAGPPKGVVFTERLVPADELEAQGGGGPVPAPGPEAEGGPLPEGDAGAEAAPIGEEGAEPEAAPAVAEDIVDLENEFRQPAMIDAQNIFGAEKIYLEAVVDLVRFHEPAADEQPEAGSEVANGE